MLEEDFEAERVSAGEIAFGAFQLLGCRALLGEPPQLVLDHRERLADRLVLGATLPTNTAPCWNGNKLEWTE